MTWAVPVSLPSVPTLLLQPYRSGCAMFLLMRCCAQAVKSFHVFSFFKYLPFSYLRRVVVMYRHQGKESRMSYHRRPSSPPPRTCAMATTTPRSSRLSWLRLKNTSFEIS